MNGLIYSTKKQFKKSVLDLANDRAKIKSLGENAYNQIIELWSAENAAQRFYKVISMLLNENKMPKYTEGPMTIIVR